MPVCRCRTEAADYRRKRRFQTNFFSGIPAFTYCFSQSYSKNNTISSRLWTCRVYPLSLPSVKTCRVYSSHWLTVWTCSKKIKGFRNQSNNSVELMPRVVKSLSMRAQSLSPFTQTYCMYSEEPSLRRLKCTEVETGQRRRAPPPDVLSITSFIHGLL
jgi:hypothetical protein